MDLFILKEAKFPSMPEEIKLLETHHHESICNDNYEVLAEGDIIHIEFKENDIVNWLKDVDCFWISTSPMTGKWKLMRILEER